VPPTEEARASCRTWLEHVVAVDCRSGLYEEANILAALEEIIEIELGARDPALLADMLPKVRAGLEAQAREEATWSARTTNDRLDCAFADLDARGIVTAQSLGDTLDAGLARIVEMSAAREDIVHGATFYHRQDLERGVRGEGLELAFTGLSEDPDPGVRIAHQKDVAREIVHVLAHHGVHASWDGSETTRIRLDPFVWQRRRVTKAPPGLTAAPPVPLLPHAPPPPVVCPHCRGKGWIANDPTQFPALCVCKGGTGG
jgi:hypothetical protein